MKFRPAGYVLHTMLRAIVFDLVLGWPFMNKRGAEPDGEDHQDAVDHV